MQEIKFPYKSTLRYWIIATILITAFVVTMLYKATHNTKMLSINYGKPFSVDTATDIYFFFAFIIAPFIFVGIYAVKQEFRREKIKRYIILNDSMISLPKSMLSNEIVTINYSDIKNIELNSYNKKPVTLGIYYNRGRVGIHKVSVFENDFKQIYDTLVHMTKPKI